MLVIIIIITVGMSNAVVLYSEIRVVIDMPMLLIA